jgi:cytochrome c oxidase assembly protein subunit 15
MPRRLVGALWHPTPATVRLVALLGVIANAGIVVTGGAVRLTKSGLGCPAWPKCSGDSLVPVAGPGHPPLNTAIEFGNRMLSMLVLMSAAACLVAAWRLRPARRDVRLLAAVLPLGVVVQAGLGGVLVLVKLPPGMVAVHYLLSAALIAAAVALYVRAGEGDGPARPLVGPALRRTGGALVAAVALVLVAGTVVTGTGPHAGDDQAPRFGFPIETVTKLHSAAVWITVALTVAMLVGLRMAGAPRGAGTGRVPPRVVRLAAALLAVEAAQGAVGYVQYALGVPAPLVALHLLGSVLTWIVVLLLAFALRERAAAGA